MADTIALYNPDGLPLVDPLQQGIERLLFAKEIKKQEAAGILFDLIYRQLGGRIGTWETTLAGLADVARDKGTRIGSDSATRLALAKLRERGLIDTVSQPRRPGLTISLLLAAPDDPQQLLFDKRDKANQPLALVAKAPPAAADGPAQPRCAAPLRSDSAQLRSATAQPDCAEQNPAIAKKSQSPQNATALEIQRGIESQRRAAGIDVSASTARQLPERPNVLTSPKYLDNSKDVLDVRAVDKNLQARDVGREESDRQNVAARFDYLVGQIQKVLGRRPDSLPAAAAICVIDGPLSEASLFACLESAAKEPESKRFAILTGALRNHLHTAGPAACARSNIVWFDDRKKIQLPFAKDRVIAMGISWKRFQRPRERQEEPP